MIVFVAKFLVCFMVGQLFFELFGYSVSSIVCAIAVSTAFLILMDFITKGLTDEDQS